MATFGGSMIRSGFGLRNPDRDANNNSIGTVQGRVFYRTTRAPMKPVMSVLYAGLEPGAARVPRRHERRDRHHDGLRRREAAFAGMDCGGEEIWAYCPTTSSTRSRAATSTTRRSAIRTTT